MAAATGQLPVGIGGAPGCSTARALPASQILWSMNGLPEICISLNAWALVIREIIHKL